MDNFVIEKESDRISSINLTVRFKTEHFDILTELSEETGITFNKVLTQCIEYALSHMEK